jgi:prepilin-type N-terminal cleavage/methylation domain-containing protein
MLKNLKNKSYISSQSGFYSYSNKAQSGFTLVELLIVIVIIGILAGVVIGVLNPVQQQNRAKDGTTRAQLDKSALSAKSLFVSSPRNSLRSPTPAEFAAGLGNIKATTTCTEIDPTVENTTCTYEINNQPLAATCGAAAYTGKGGTTQCVYAYWRDGGAFRIAARGAAEPVMLFVYHFEELATGNVTEGFYTCDAATYAITDSPATSSACSLMN